MNSTFNTILSTEQSTVVTEYVPETKRSDAYQSEAALEKAFIKMLGEQGYEYKTIHNSESLITNLREQLEKLNDYQFTDSEWERFFNNNIANQNEGIEEIDFPIELLKNSKSGDLFIFENVSRNFTCPVSRS